MDSDMNFNEFKDFILEHAAVRYPDMEPSINEVVKNNGLVFSGFTMRSKDGGAISVSPTLYLDNFFDQVVSGSTPDDVAEKIFSLYDEHLKKSADFGVDANLLSDPAFIRENLFMQLVNKERNEEILRDCPHDDFYDLTVVYRVRVGIDPEGVASYRINNSMLDMSGIARNELYDLAKENTRKVMGNSVMSMRDVLLSMMGPDAAFLLPPEMSEPPMYVISNDSKVNGACGMLFDDNLAKIAEEVDSDLVVLPSSIHECIVVPYTNCSVGELMHMVQEVNAGQVAPEERLSDNVYLYNAADHKLSDAETYFNEHKDIQDVYIPKEESEDETIMRHIGRHR